MHATILAGEGEYSSGTVMELFQHDVESALGWKTTLCVAHPLDDVPDFPMGTFPGLGALDGADLLVVYTRFRRLPDEEMECIERYLKRAAPVLGLRTSSHAFKFRSDERWGSWNEDFGRDILGTSWIAHHGHSSTTKVHRVGGGDHPILDGVPESFESRSWLYIVDSETTKNVLLMGDPVDPEIDPVPGPVAWTRTGVRRVFYSSLGHPDDFSLTAFRRLLVNAAGWCVER